METAPYKLLYINAVHGAALISNRYHDLIFNCNKITLSIPEHK